MPKKRKIFYGWWIVSAAATLFCFSGGAFLYGFTVFFNPIRNTFGWTAALTSVAFSLQRLEQGVLAPLVGFLVDRVGPRRLMLFGWGLVGLGFLLMSRIDSLWQFYASFAVIAIGFSFGAFISVLTTVANWFNKKRSRAMTIIYVGFGISGVLVPLVAWLIGQYGWRDSLFMIGIATWIIGFPISLLMRHRPEQYGYLPDGETRVIVDEPVNPGEIVEQGLETSVAGFTAKGALRTRTFWLLAAAFFFQHIGTSAVMVHIVPYLESVNVTTAVAASAVTGMTLFSLIGRIGFGILGDYSNKRYLIAIALALQTIGLVMFSFINADRSWLIVLFLLVYATGYGGPMPLRPALRADYFGIKSFGTITGLMAALSAVGGLFSPVVAGWVYDVIGDYSPVWQLFALLSLPSIPLILLTRHPRVKKEP
jgi:MFS family permease